jgi:hypothetical protein
LLSISGFVFYGKLAGSSDAGRKVSSKETNTAYLIDIIDFAYLKLWKDKDFLHQKYVIESLSIAQVSRQILSSRAAVKDDLIEFGIARRQQGKPGKRPAQVAYGYRMVKGELLQHEGEQTVISVIQKMACKGTSLREICEYLLMMGVPTKRRGVRWHPEMVRRILSRTKKIE